MTISIDIDNFYGHLHCPLTNLGTHTLSTLWSLIRKLVGQRTHFLPTWGIKELSFTTTPGMLGDHQRLNKPLTERKTKHNAKTDAGSSICLNRIFDLTFVRQNT